MSKKNIKITRSLLNEVILNEMVMNEGFWDSIKHGLAKTLGTWEKGGSIRGRGERDKKAQAQAKKALARIGEKAGKAAEVMMKRFATDFKEAGYPNQKDQYEFIEQTLEIDAFYDSLANAVKKGEMEAALANEIIEDLRIVVKKILDYDLADVYKHFREGRELDEKKMFGVEVEDDKKEDAKEEEGPISGKDKESTVMGSLKSNALPLTLAAIGGTSILGSVFANSDLFKDMTTKVTKTAGTPDQWVNQMTKQSLLIGPQDGEGMTQMVARMSGTKLTPDSTLQDFLDAAKELGIDKSNIDQLGAELGAQPGAYDAAIQGTAMNTPLKEVFPLSQKSKWFMAKGAKAVTNLMQNTLTKIPGQAAKTVAKRTAIGALGAKAAPFLAAIGISLLPAAAGVKALRMKGLKKSRAQVLNDLLTKLDFLKAPEKQDEPPPKMTPPVGPLPPGPKPVVVTEPKPSPKPSPEPSPEPEEDKEGEGEGEGEGDDEGKPKKKSKFKKPKKPYEFPLYGDAGLEKILKDFLTDRGVDVETDAADDEIADFLGDIEDWMTGNATRIADKIGMDSREYLRLAEAKKKKGPKIPIKKSSGRGEKGRSLDALLRSIFGKTQGRMQIFQNLSEKDLRILRNRLVKHAFKFLKKQKAPIKEQETMVVERWLRLAGVDKKIIKG